MYLHFVTIFGAINFMIQFSYADKKLSFNKKTKLKQLVQIIFKKEKQTLAHINYVFCSDDYLLTINQQFLNHHTYTDIITFPLSNKNEPIEAEIYISVDRIKENALQFKTNFQQELARVVAHGALHLCGFKDKTKAQIIQMRAKEQQYITYFEKKLD